MKFFKRSFFFLIVVTCFVVFSITKKSENTNTLHISFEKPKEIAEILKEKLGLKDEQKSWINIWDYKKEIIGVLFICVCIFVFSPPTKSKNSIMILDDRKNTKSSTLETIEEENPLEDETIEDVPAIDLSESEYVPPQVPISQVEKRSPSLLELPIESSAPDLSENEHVPPQVRISRTKIQEDQENQEDDQEVQLSNQAELYLSQHNYDEALIVYNNLLSISINKFGKNDPNVAYAMHNVGRVYHLSNNFTEAIKFYLEALKIYEKVFGENPVQSTNTLSSIYAAYRVIGDKEKEEEYRLKFKKALQNR